MGLKELKKVAREKEFEQFLATFGITKADLCYLHEAIKTIKEFSPAQIIAPYSLSQKENEEIKKKNARGMSMEQLAKAFEGEVVEFYENGKKPEKSNN